jgi:hypothetical protein
MLRHVHRGYATFSPAAAFVAALAMVSCGGSMDGETVSGSSRVVSNRDPAPLASDTLRASATDKVTVCHRGSDKLVPQDAVSDHLAHGDTLGSCDAISCPCFGASDITDAEVECENLDGTRIPTCLVSDPLYWLDFDCNVGSTNPLIDISDFFTQIDGSGPYCSRDPLSRGPDLTQGEYDACVAVLLESVYCQG